jgi:hypothetical protein
VRYSPRAGGAIVKGLKIGIEGVFEDRCSGSEVKVDDVARIINACESGW